MIMIVSEREFFYESCEFVEDDKAEAQELSDDKA